jgi:iron complex transport system permease protein
MVATGLLTGFSFLNTNLGVVTLSLIGAFVFGLIILGLSTFVRNTVSLLLVGIMLGSFTSAITSLIQSISSPESLKNFMMWGMGSLQATEFDQIPLIFVVFIIGIALTSLLMKPLNALVLGEEAALSLGIPVKRTRIILIGITALLAGCITAYCGPIAFVGLAIPNLCRILFRTQDHTTLLLSNILLGSIFMLFCDILIQSLEHQLVLPINVITSIIGAPFVVFIILKRMA